MPGGGFDVGAPITGIGQAIVPLHEQSRDVLAALLVEIEGTAVALFIRHRAASCRIERPARERAECDVQ
jgi:hypothetical protein